MHLYCTVLVSQKAVGALSQGPVAIDITMHLYCTVLVSYKAEKTLPGADKSALEKFVLMYYMYQHLCTI